MTSCCPTRATRCDRAISVDAPAAVLFRSLCQLRVAPYSYDLLDNLGRRNPRELTSRLERLEVGQRFMRIFSLASFAPDDHLTLRSRGVAPLTPTSTAFFVGDTLASF